MGLGAHMALDCDFTRPPSPPDPEEVSQRDAVKQRLKNNTLILGPQSSAPLGGIGITETSLQQIVEGRPIFEFGVINYNDIFPGSSLHVTKFCYRINAYRSDKGEIVPSYELCEHWNCADDECKADRRAYDLEKQAADQPKPAPTALPKSK